MSGALLDWPCVSFKADVQPTHCPSVDSDATTESAFDDFLSLLVTSNGATVGPPNLDARCQSAASPVEAPTPPCKEAAERSRVDKPSARRSVHAGSSRPPAAHPVRRVISNDTYLRRMHLSPEQTIALMPSLASSLLPVATKASVRARMSFKKVRHHVDMFDEAGQRWGVVLECVLSANKKQLHCRLGAGWAKFCKDNCAAVSDTVVMAHVTSGPENVLVKIEKRASV